MNRPWILIAASGAVAAVFGTFPLLVDWPAPLICLIGMGLVQSCVMYHAVYYANADPTNPGRSIGINEAVIGTSGVAGQLLLATLAWDDATSWRPYIAGIVMSTVSLSAAMLLWRHHSNGDNRLAAAST